VVLATRKDPLEVDDDRDGFSEKQGDCNDRDSRIHPNGAVTVTSARFETPNFDCPDTGTWTADPAHILVTFANNSCTPLTISSSTTELTYVTVFGTTNFLGQSFTRNNAPFSPNSVAAGSEGTIRVEPRFDCINFPGRSSAFNEVQGRVILNTSAGVFNVTTQNRHRTNFPLQGFLVGVGPTQTSQGAGSSGEPSAQASPISGEPVGREVHDGSISRPRVSWSSELRAEGATGRLILNEAIHVVVSEGRTQGSELLRPGQHRVEAHVLSAAGPGVWEFDFAGAEGFEPGSLEVLEGQAALVTDERAVFQISGRAGERLAFTFKVRR
jgi:hypothetical protein